MKRRQGLGQVEVKFRRVRSTLARAPLSIDALAARSPLVRLVIALKAAKGRHPPLERASVHEGGTFLPWGTNHALAEVDETGAARLA